MTENENADQDQRENTLPRGSGALIGRFLAVGLFVALGTFAVIQSLSGGSGQQTSNLDPENNLTDPAENGDDETPNVTPIVDTTSLIKDDSSLSIKKSVASTKPSMPSTSGIDSSGTFSRTLKPATPIVANPKQTVGTFEEIKPKSPPPNRIAQLDNGSARSTFGIGGPATTPTPQKSTFGSTANSLKQKVGEATSNVTNRFDKLGGDIKNAANNVTDRAKSAFGSTASRFGSTTKPGTAPSGSPFTQKPQIKPIEAKSSLGTTGSQRPFSNNKPDSGSFRSQSLSPISGTSRPQTRSPLSTTTTTQSNSFPPAKKPAATTTPPKSPFPSTVSAPTQPRKTTSTFPPPPRATSSSLTSQTRLPSATTRAPIIQASRVSAKPGDRQYEGVQSPSMIIQKFSPREIQVNQTADFELKVRNVGRVSVDDVLIVDQVPEGARYVDANPKPSSQSRTGELKWQLGTMKPGEERTILLQLQPTVPGEIGSVAQFYFGGRATNRTKVTQPKLKITHTADPKILIGNNVIFDVVVENTGNGPAKDVVIQEEVPELLEYQDGSRELEYEVGTLMPGQSRRVQLGLRAARVGRLRNVMFASAKGGIQSKHETDVEIIAPKLTTSSEGPTRRYIQRQVSHTFTVANNGTAAATNLRLIARLPSGLRFVSANNRGRYDRNSHAVIWQMRNLAAGGSGDVEVTTTPVESGEQNIKFEADADLNQSSETVQNLNVEHLVDVFFDIDDVVDPIEIGADTRYRIRLVNQGTNMASNVQIQIDFPQGLQPTAVDGDLRNQIRGQQIVFEPITSLRPGEQLNVTVSAKGRADGDHRVVVNMKAGERATPVSKEETTRVYSDR